MPYILDAIFIKEDCCFIFFQNVMIQGYKVYSAETIISRGIRDAEKGFVMGLWRPLLIGHNYSSAGEENGNLLQYSCLGNPIDRGAWWGCYNPWSCKESDMTERLNSIHWLCCPGQVIYLGAIVFFFCNYEEADFLRFLPPLYPSYVV